MSDEVSCPNCGAPVTLAHRSVRLASCQNCGSLLAIERDGWVIKGTSARLSSFASVMSLGDVGTLRGRDFQAIGRIRCAYEDGFWDEWYLLFSDGAAGWLQEDEGELTLVSRERLSAIPRPTAIRPGETIDVGGRAVYIREKGSAEIEGVEGQLPSGVRIGQAFDYIDGLWNGRAVMLELSEREVELFIGDEIDLSELNLRGGSPS